MGITTNLVKTSFLVLALILGAPFFSEEEAEMVDLESVEVVIASWDFESEDHGWENSFSGGKRWGTADDGTLAYTRIVRECFLFWCDDVEYRYRFHSNDDSEFFLVNKYTENGPFQEVDLISPNFTTSDLSSIKLSFYHHFRKGGDNDKGLLEYSINGGGWNPLENYTTRQGDHDNFKKVEVTLPPEVENKANVKIRFRYDGAGDEYYWAVDNVQITGVIEIPEGTCDNVEIRANFCTINDEGYKAIELSTPSAYETYRWELNGIEVPGTANMSSIKVDIAGTYYLIVTDATGCTGTASITTSKELIRNGDFESGNFENNTNNSFTTDYTNKTGSNGSLQDEGTFAVDTDANEYHSNFDAPEDHTTGDGRFLMVNGHEDEDMVIWEQTVDVEPGVDYYFSAWATNLHKDSPAQLQFFVEDEPAGTIADLTGKPVGDWFQFYSPSGEFWNSGTNTTATIRIVNLNTAAGGNDFGIDDISFGNLDPLPFTIAPPEEITVCETHRLNLYANLEGGRAPFTYKWTGPDGFVSDEENPFINNITKAQEGIYTVTITDFYGCEGETDSTLVTVNTDCHNLNFDGQDDYALIGDYYDPVGPFTLEAWVKPHSIEDVSTILSKTNISDNSKGYALGIDQAGRPYFEINGTKITSDYVLDTNRCNSNSPLGTNNCRWYHLAVSFSGSKAVRLYVDGIKVKEETFDALPADTPNPFLIGAAFDENKPWEPENYFEGWIEEVRIWNTRLTTKQIRFMMNQRLEKNEEGKVAGKEIPLKVPGELSWIDLRGYYRLLVTEIEHNEQEHEENHGITKNHADNNRNGFLVNMDENQENSAPLPYVSGNTGSWDNPATWAHPHVWDPPNSKGIKGNAINWNIVKIEHDITSPNRNITLLGLLSEPGSILTIENPEDHVYEEDEEYSKEEGPNSGQSLRITKYLDLDGVIDLVGESQLLQNPGSIVQDVVKNANGAIVENSEGAIERDQQGTKNSFNYNYWSSPVSTQGSANNSGFTVENVLKDGTYPSAPADITFGSHYSAADAGGVPITISSYWLNIFTNSPNNSYTSWQMVRETGQVKTGEGFTMKGSSGAAEITDRQNYVFRGKPNNGTIKLKVNAGEDGQVGNDYLIGNPYPSAIDAREFINDNLKARNPQGNIFNGSIYFWDHFGNGTHYLMDYVGGYAVYNLSGGIRAAQATDPRINDELDENGNIKEGGEIPGDYIPVGQAFYISTVLAPELSTLETVHGGDIVFQNSQRAFMTDDQVDQAGNPDDASVFKSKLEEKPSPVKSDLRSKIWLSFHSPTGYLRQLLVTMDRSASDGFDLGFDAPLKDAFKEDLYWMIENHRFVIQGVPDFRRDREIPLGIKIEEEGEFSISIDQLKNIPDNFEIYIKDSLTSTRYDLREGPFTDTLSKGRVQDRYYLVFQKEYTPEPGEGGKDENPEEEKEGEESGKDKEESEKEEEDVDETLLKSLDVVYFSENRQLVLLNPHLIKVHSVKLQNVLGQQIHEYQSIPHQEEVSLPVKRFGAGVYILSIHSEKGILNKKIIIE